MKYIPEPKRERHALYNIVVTLLAAIATYFLWLIFNAY